jgi:hypothetical protein
MKIGILTFHWADNYGAVIQAYASLRYLKSLGHEVSILNYRPAPTTMTGSFLKHVLGRTPRACVEKWVRLARRAGFQRFRKNKLCLSGSPVSDRASLDRITQDMDLLITGSDQVWNPVLLDDWDCFDAYLLNFGSDSVKRVSYAASLGHSSMDTLAPWAAQMGSLLKRIDAVSVRESSGEIIVQVLTGRGDVELVGDPTLLLSADDYRKLFSKPWKKLPKTFSYILHGQDQDAAKIIQQVDNYFNTTVPLCNLTNTTVLNRYVRPSPEEWLQRIDHAKLVVTNSFHATVFCLLFHTPFIVLPVSGSWSTMNSRVVELLEKMNLMDRLVDPMLANDITPLLHRQIDWTIVDEQIIELREAGVSFLSKNCGTSS